MSLAVAAALLLLMLGMVALAIRYFATRRKGKSRVALASVSGITAIWLGYVSLLSLNWINLIIVFLLRGDPALALQSLSPNWQTTIFGFIACSLLSYLLYRLAVLELSKNRLPINASALELEEPGRRVGVFELTNAHIRYLMAGKPDRPVINPGESAYQLPALPPPVDWATLSASLLQQLEPNLIGDSFRFIRERKFYRLYENNAFDEAKSAVWIVYPAPTDVSDEEICRAFSEIFTKASDDIPNQATFVACVKSSLSRDNLTSLPEGQSIRIISEATLIERSLDFSQYAASLIRRFEQRPISGTNYSLKDCFVSPKLYATRSNADLGVFQNDSTEVDLLSALREWSTSPTLEHLSIIGEFGQGKSTALLAFCASWAHQWAGGYRSGRIPLLIELRGKSPRRQARDRFLAEWGDRYGLRGEALLNLVQAGRAILIFEGFDEIQDAGLRYDRFQQFKALWSFSYPEAKIVFTGRPNFFLDTNERERLLRSSPSARDAGLEASRVYSLAFLDIPAISKVLNRYPNEVREEIVAQCERDPAFLDIARRPSMLPVIGNQWKQIKNSLQAQGGITSATIISYFIDFLYMRKEADQDRLGEFQLLHRKVRHFFTQHIAWRMAATGLHNTIDNDGFVLAIEEAYRNLDAEFRFHALESDDDPQIATSIAALGEKFKDRPLPEIIAAIATDVRTNGLFVPDPAGGRDNLYFPHKQYYEFVLAEIFVRWLTRRKSVPWLTKMPARPMMEMLEFEPMAIFFASGLLPIELITQPPKVPFLIQLQHEIASLSITLAQILMHWVGKRPKDLQTILRYVPTEFKYLAAYGLGNTFPLMFLTSVGFVIPIASMAFAFLDKHPAAVTMNGNVRELLIAGLAALGAGAAVLTSTFYLRLRRTAYLSGRLQIDLCYLMMEIYRTDNLRQIMERKGTKACVSVILLTSRCKPRGSLAFRDIVMIHAKATLGLDHAILPEDER